jgi:gas vesicle protein
MRRAILAVSAFAISAFANVVDDLPDYYAPQTFAARSNKITYEVTVDWDKVNDMKKSISKKFDDFNKLAKSELKNTTMELGKAVQDAYKNTAAKMIMDFGEHIGPILENTGELISEVSVADGCNSACAVKCWNPSRADTVSRTYTFGFNNTCFRACGCRFKFESWTQQQAKEFENTAKDLGKNVNELAKFGQDIAREASEKIVPALQKFGKKAAELQDDYAATVKSIAVKDLGCNEACVNECFSDSGCMF